jgi:hypothetical protein
MLLLSVSSVLMPSEVYERFSNPDSTMAQDLSSLSSEEPPSTLDIHPDAGPDIVVKEGSVVGLDGTQSYQDEIVRVWSDSFDNLTKVDSFVNVTIESGNVHLNETSFAIEETFADFSGFQLEDDQALTQLWWDSVQEVLAWHSDAGDPTDTWEKLVKSTPFEVTDRFDFIGHVDYVYTNAQTRSEVFPLLFMDANSIRVTDLYGPTSNAIDFSIYGGAVVPPLDDRHALLFYDGSGGQHNTLNILYDSHFNERIQAEVRFDSQTRTLEAELQDHFGSTLGIDSSVIPAGAFTLSKFGIGAMGRGFSGTSDGYSDNMTIAAWGYSDGEVASVQIDPQEPFENWSWLDINSVEPSGTDIKVDVLDEFGTPLMTNIDSDDCPLSLYGLIDPVMYPKIVLKASLTTTWNETPLLLDWNVSYSIPSPLTFSWDVNHLEDGNSDGNFTNDADLMGPIVFYEYGDDGAYSATLTVNNTFGNVSTDSCVVNVVNEKPHLSVTFPASPRVGSPLTFAATASDPGSDDLTLTWDWGDGSNESQTHFNDGMGPDPPVSPDVSPITVVDQWNHTYSQGGTYIVSLTAIDDDGGRTTETYEMTLLSAEAGPDQVVNEGETVQLSGSGSEGSSLDYYWSDDFDDDSRISESVNTTVGDGSVVLADLFFSISNSFETDPGFVIEDDMPNTELWWDPVNERLRWYVDREDPRDHYEKLVGFLPFPVTDTMDISASVDYLYWRADRWAIADPLLLQKNGSWRLGTKWGPNNNTLDIRMYGGDPLGGDVDRHSGMIWDDAGSFIPLYQIDYDMHYWELFTSHVTWDSDTDTLYGEVRDPIGTLVGSGSTVVSENFTFHKYGMGSYGEGNIDGEPHIGEGFADNYSISAYGYRSPGEVTSELITAPGPSGAWGILNVSAVEPNRTQIDIQVLDEFGSPVLSGIRPSDCPLSLGGLIDPATYPRIMLRATLSTDRNETPTLLSWNVSYHAQSTIMSYQWDVNQFVDLDLDGNYTNDIDLVGENVSYVYGDNGIYISHLTVLDSSNATTVDSCDITVLNLDPTASTTPPPSPAEGVALTFNASSDDPGSDDLALIWDWGDGSNESWTYFNDGMGPDPPNSPDVNPMSVAGQWSHTYGHGGVYLVNLTVLDDDGGAGYSEFLINVSNVGPTAVIDIANPNPVAEGSAVLLGGYFDDPSWLDNHTVIWDFGDGQKTSGGYSPGIGSTHHVVDNVTHTYGDDGAFQVMLNVTDDYGASDSSVVIMDVLNVAPTANISCPAKVSIGYDFQCYSGATDPGSDDLTFDWDWGDGSAHNVSVHYNDGIGPDPDPSPGPIYPFLAADTAVHAYSILGNHTVVLNVSDDDGGYVLLQFEIWVVDLPETTIVIGDPKYVSTDFFIASSTPISFSVLDKSDEGIESAYYNIDGGTWTQYLVPFYVPSEGPHTIYYNSTDLLGGAEPTKSFDLVVDNTPPSSSVIIGTPNYTGADIWIAPSTTLTITSVDSLCGLSSLEYELDGSGWQPYIVPITVPGEGMHILLYRGIDNLGNTEDPGSLIFGVDATAPSTTTIIGAPNYTAVNLWISPTTTLGMASTDGGCGVFYVEYELDSGGWQTYTTPIMVPQEGSHLILYRGVDNLGNTEDPGSLLFFVDGTPPASDDTVGTPSFVSIDLWISPATQITISSADTGCGLQRIEFRLDGGGWQTYTAPITITQEGSHVLSYRGVDNLGNTETAQSLDFIVDGSPPASDIAVGSPSYLSTDLWTTQSTTLTITSDDSGSGLSHVEYQLDGGTWLTYAAPLTVQQEGPHVLMYRGVDNLGTVESDRRLDFIVDNTPPTSVVDIGSPNYTSLDLWISPSTPVGIGAADSGSGLSGIEFSVDGGAWQDYVNPLTFVDEGPGTLSYRATDNLGNMEETLTLDFVVDGSPPTSHVTVGEPNYTEATLWISPSTLVTMASSDDGCGLSLLEYQLDGGNWQEYLAPFNIPQEGSHTVSFRGSDNLGNLETEQSMTLVVDGTPPSSTITIGQPREDVEPVQVYEETPFMLASVDAGCGVRVIQYKLDYADWTNYTGSFNLTGHTLGTHVIQFRGLDNLGNTEDIQSLSIELIEPERLEENLKLLIAIVFAIILAIVGLLVTLKRPFVSKDGEQRRGFTFLAIALPFVLVEISTGILSLLVPAIEVPPWFGLGMILDLAILIAGIVVELVVFVKNKSPREEEEESEGDAVEETE